MIKVEVILAPCVESELGTIWDYIACDNPEAATRVIEAVYETFTLLATTPELGRLRKFRNPKLKGVRSWPVSGFDNYLIFYRHMAGTLQVLHVFHGARNLDAIFAGN